MLKSFHLQQYFWIAVIASLASCNVNSPKSTLAPGSTRANPTASHTPVFSTQTSQSALATLTAVLTSTIPSASKLDAPTASPIPLITLDGLRVVYVNAKGDLYLHDSHQQAIQLTQAVKEDNEDRPPLISDDGQKIIFYRTGEANLDSIFVINADGTGEQMLVNMERLSVFGNAYDESTSLYSLVFVPGTHLLLLNTYQQNNFDPESAGWLPVVGNDLFVVNTDNGEIKQLRTPWEGGNFLAAPNGKWIAVQTLDHIDVIDTDGHVVRSDLVTYQKSESHVVVPMYWTADSRELIILPSEIPLFAGVPVSRTVSRYPLDDSSSVEINLTPSPMYDYYAVSPDGKWIAYSYDMGSLDPQTTNGVYLGNLRDGTSKLLYVPQPNDNTGMVDVPLYYEGWSPDSVHLIFRDDNFRNFIANIYGKVVSIEMQEGIELADWLDKDRYLMENGTLGDISGQNFVQVIEHSLDTFVFLRP